MRNCSCQTLTDKLENICKNCGETDKNYKENFCECSVYVDLLANFCQSL